MMQGLSRVEVPADLTNPFGMAAGYSAIWKPEVKMGEGVPIWTKWLLSNCWWRNLNHFAKCSKFEQPLHQIVTRREKWSTSAGSGWPRGFSLVVQVSGGALTRTSSVAPSIKIKSNFRGNRVDTIFGAGLAPCSFFEQRPPPCSFFAMFSSAMLSTGFLSGMDTASC